MDETQKQCAQEVQAILDKYGLRFDVQHSVVLVPITTSVSPQVVPEPVSETTPAPESTPESNPESTPEPTEPTV